MIRGVLMIEFNNVSKIYNNNVKALSDVSVKINSGDFCIFSWTFRVRKVNFYKNAIKRN